MELGIRIDDALVKAAFRRSPEILRANVDRNLARGAQEMARAGRDAAPKALSALANSIRVDNPEPMSYVIAPGVNYARSVEEGTGPAAGRPKYYPNPDTLRQYIETVPASRGFAWARKGTGRREQQRLDIWHRSRALAWYIYQHGTPAQPYMKPTFDNGVDRVRQLVEEGLAQTARELANG